MQYSEGHKHVTDGKLDLAVVDIHVVTLCGLVALMCMASRAINACEVINLFHESCYQINVLLLVSLESYFLYLSLNEHQLTPPPKQVPTFTDDSYYKPNSHLVEVTVVLLCNMCNMYTNHLFIAMCIQQLPGHYSPPLVLLGHL